MIKNLILSTILAATMSGCAGDFWSFFGNKSKNAVALKAPKAQYIKGTIAVKTPNKSGFCYAINAKEPSARPSTITGCCYDGSFAKGDLVYAQVEGAEITYMRRLIANYVAPERSHARAIQGSSRHDKKSAVSLPSEEKISF